MLQARMRHVEFGATSVCYRDWKFKRRTAKVDATLNARMKATCREGA